MSSGPTRASDTMCRSTQELSNGRKITTVELCENSQDGRPCSLVTNGQIVRLQDVTAVQQASSSKHKALIIHQDEGPQLKPKPKPKPKVFDAVDIKFDWKGPKYKLVNTEDERRKQARKAIQYSDDGSYGLPRVLPSQTLLRAPSPPLAGTYLRDTAAYSTQAVAGAVHPYLSSEAPSYTSSNDSGYQTVYPSPVHAANSRRAEVVGPSSTASTASSHKKKGKAPAREVTTPSSPRSLKSALKITVPSAHESEDSSSHRASQTKLVPQSPTPSNRSTQSNPGLSRPSNLLVTKPVGPDSKRDSGLGTSIGSPASATFDSPMPQRSLSRDTHASGASESSYGQHTRTRAEERELARERDRIRRAESLERRDRERRDAFSRLSGQSISPTVETFDNSRSHYYNDGTTSNRRPVPGTDALARRASRRYVESSTSASSSSAPSPRRRRRPDPLGDPDESASIMARREQIALARMRLDEEEAELRSRGRGGGASDGKESD